MSFENPIDARNYTYDEWLRFAFDHPVSEDSWYYTEEYHFVCDEPTVIGYYTRLFQEPLPSLGRYTDAQLEQGLWFVASCQLRDMLWNEDIPLDLRVGCIAAMPTFFDRFFRDKPLETICFMWWDVFRDFGSEPLNPAIVEAMVRALERVLSFDSEDCQRSAIHGLGHLDHPDKERIIRDFLARNPQLPDGARVYSEAAIRGEVL